MSRESTCRCLICGLERSLTQQPSEADRQERYRQFAGSRSLQPAFPAVSDLIAYLRTCRSAANGAHPADRILAELLQTNAIKANTPTLRDLPLLAFIPTVHSTSRQVATRYPSLSADDIAQHVVVSLLQILGSPEFCNRNSHVAYAISGLLKRNTFEWADRECRLLIYRARQENLFDEPAGVDSAERWSAARSSGIFSTVVTCVDCSPARIWHCSSSSNWTPPETAKPVVRKPSIPMLPASA
jgi:hypothetical protein